MKVMFLDGSSKEFEKGLSAFDIAQSKSGCYFSVRLVRDAE